MTKPVRELMDYIDGALCRMSMEDAKDVWNLLTALRGPDNGDYALKEVTTEVIRTMLLPRCEQTCQVPANFSYASSKRIADLKQARVIHFREWFTFFQIRQDRLSSVHFVNHIKYAVDALFREEKEEESEDSSPYTTDIV